MVAASIISIAANPYAYRWARRLATSRKSSPMQAPAAPPPVIQRRRAILVGFGPVGRIVHKLLVDTGGETIVVELNLESVRELRSAGHSAIYGDVRQPGTLIEAGIETTETLILSTDIEDAPDIIRQSLQINPKLRVLARCGHLRQASALHRAGADFVVAGEAEVGVALTEAVTTLSGKVLEDPANRRAQIRRQLYESIN
jgi:CPA2 family monovalent cation:H+ antiporter-2